MNQPAPAANPASVTPPLRPVDAARWDESRPLDVAGDGPRPIQVFRVGPLYSRFSGEKVDDITDAKLAEMVRTFRATRERSMVPIDWVHGSSPGLPQSPATGLPLGEVVDFIHRPGVGLWAVPAYTDEGRDVVAKCGGRLKTSPEFTTEPVYDRSTGELLGQQILAVALTPRPMQDRLESVLLSETAGPTGATNPAPSREGVSQMADDPTGAAPPAPALADAPPPPPPPNGPPDLEALMAKAPGELVSMLIALREENAMLKGQAESARAQVAAAPVAEMAEAVHSRKYAELERNLNAVKADLQRERRDRDIDALIASGVIAPASRAYTEALYAHPALYAEHVKRAKANPEVPLGERGIAGAPAGVSGPSATVAYRDAVRAYAEATKTSIDKAEPAFRKVNPTLHAAYVAEQNGGR